MSINGMNSKFVHNLLNIVLSFVFYHYVLNTKTVFGLHAYTLISIAYIVRFGSVSTERCVYNIIRDVILMLTNVYFIEVAKA